MPRRPGPQPIGAGDRPSVSVVVPFAGEAAALRQLLDGLGNLGLRQGDEVIVADNGPSARAPVTHGGSRVIVADFERTSYHARNRGAEEARNDWVLFIDADCRPTPALLDRYFEDPIPQGCGLVAGGVLGATRQAGILPTWARSRRQLSEEHLVNPLPSFPHPATGTGNLLVRKHVWEALGGFHEGVRSGADVEFCWRVQDAGWTMVHRREASVEHEYGTRLSTLVRQAIRHAAGRRWVNRRYPGAFERPRPLRELTRSLAAAGVWMVLLRWRRAVHKLVDGVALGAGAVGWHFGRNAVRPVGEAPLATGGAQSLVVVTDAFPARSETFVYNEGLTLERQGWRIRVESLARPARVERSVARRLRTDYFEDDAPLDKLRDLLWLVRRHPIRCIADLRGRDRWRREEEVWPLTALAPAARRLVASGERHIHAHFAAGGALQAMRLSRLLGITFSFTAHAYDIFQTPRNLPEKLRAARFSAAECDYAADHMRVMAGKGAASRTHRIATGTDGSRFRRTKPYADDGRVLAIGRLVEKKGFTHLIDAAVILRDEPRVKEIVIAGEGPLRQELLAQVERLGLTSFVRLHGALWGPDAVRAMLEEAALLVIPSVIASDGDRDALPLVAYEGLAMEVPVIASDLVGLPELIQEPWGRLVPPGEPEALATAISQLLDVPADERFAAVGLGREHVLTRFDPEREAQRLGSLLRAV